MAEKEKLLEVTHINIRLSISVLVFKLFVVELVSLIVIILLYTVIFTTESPSFFSISLDRFTLPLLVVLAIVKSIVALFIIVQWINEYYEITPRAVYHRRGVIFRNEEKYLFDHIQTMVINQTFLGRLFNFGSVTLLDYRRNKLEEMYNIHNPIRYAHIIESLLPKSDERKVYIRGGIDEEEFD